MQSIVYPNGNAKITIPAAESIAVYTYGQSNATVYRELGYPNFPPTLSLLGVVQNGQTVFGPYASGATIIINAGADQVLYEVGTSPVVQEAMANSLQGTPGVLNATGALTAAMMLSGIVTSTTAAAVTATVPTGAVMELASQFEIGESFDWSAIATGANAFTVTAAASGHTLVGVGTVATVTSGRFRTRKTAFETFVTYRLS